MHRRWIIILAAAAAAIVLYAGALLSILLVHGPQDNPLTNWPVFPVACTTRGCITSASWLQQHQLAIGFAQSTGQTLPKPKDSLTTTIRKHLVQHAFLSSPIRQEDITRYREDVLHTTNEDIIQQYLPMSADEYDSLVLKPFLQQEALRFQHKVESIDELYHILASEQTVVLLLFHFKWDTDTGKAVTRD